MLSSSTVPPRAVLARAVGIDVQRMIVDPETALLRNGDLPALDLRIVEFLDVPALHADEVIVVSALVQFENRLAALKMVAYEEPCLLELGKHAVDRCEPRFGAFLAQNSVHLLGGEMAYRAFFEKFQYAQPWQRGLEPDGLQVAG